MPLDRIVPVPRWILTLITLVVVAACVLMRYTTAGHVLLAMGTTLYPIATASHCVFHLLSTWDRKPISALALMVMAASHALLILGFMFQYDFNDRGSWFTITKLLGTPERYGGIPTWNSNWQALNVAAFLPALVSWPFVVRGRVSLRKRLMG
jgi:hypothetical protein